MEGKVSIWECFEDLRDPRSSNRDKGHPLLSVVAIALCAAVAGADDWPEVVAFGRRQDLGGAAAVHRQPARQRAGLRRGAARALGHREQPALAARRNVRRRRLFDQGPQRRPERGAVAQVGLVPAQTPPRQGQHGHQTV
jgi:hypothetical protein